MVGSVNKTILLGNLGRDPEIRSMQSGAKMASFSIATSKRWKDRNTQEQKEKTSWHNIVVLETVQWTQLKNMSKKALKFMLKESFKLGNGKIKMEMTDILQRSFYRDITVI